MGAVFLAEDRELGIHVAVKAVPPEFAFDEKAINDMRREVQAALRLTHPNVVRVFDLKREGDAYFIVMEYVDGFTLRQIVHKRGRLTVDETLRILAPAAAAIDYAHSQKVIHRDVKSSNIMLSRQREVKVLDFGIARVIKETSSRISQTTTSGTLAYMSPEQLAGQPIDGRSDVYSLGVVAYEMLAGRPPFHAGAIEYQILHVPPEPLREVPGHVDKAVTRCLAKKAEERFARARDFVAALEGKEVAAPAKPPEPRARAAAVPEAPAETRDEVVPVRRKKSRVAFWLAGLGGLAVVVAVMGWAWNRYDWGAETGKSTNREMEEKVTVLMPANLVGLTVDEAAKTLREYKLDVGGVSTEGSSDMPAGRIIRQRPDIGEQVKQGDTVDLVISSGPAAPISETAASAETEGTGALKPAGPTISQPNAGKSRDDGREMREKAELRRLEEKQRTAREKPLKLIDSKVEGPAMMYFKGSSPEIRYLIYDNIKFRAEFENNMYGIEDAEYVLRMEIASSDGDHHTVNKTFSVRKERKKVKAYVIWKNKRKERISPGGKYSIEVYLNGEYLAKETIRARKD